MFPPFYRQEDWAAEMQTHLALQTFIRRSPTPSASHLTFFLVTFVDLMHCVFTCLILVSIFFFHGCKASYWPD